MSTDQELTSAQRGALTRAKNKAQKKLDNSIQYPGRTIREYSASAHIPGPRRQPKDPHGE